MMTSSGGRSLGSREPYDPVVTGEADADGRGETATLGEALEAIRLATGADRASVAEIDREDGTFSILGASGERLLPVGERFDLDESTHFVLAADGQVFVGADFDRDRRFRRPVDERVRGYGFRAGVALPLGDAPDEGALALHFREPGDRVARAARLLEPVAEALASAVKRGRVTDVDVAILDEDPLVGRGLLHLLADTPDLRPRLATTVGALSESSPDVVVVTADDGRAERAVNALRAGTVEAPLVLVAGVDSPELLREALAAGVAGVVPRAHVVEALADALRVTVDGGTWLPGPVSAPARDLLSARELEVLLLLDRGLRLAQVAAELGIAHATVKAHTRNVFRKLEATSRAEACYQARAAGLLR